MLAAVMAGCHEAPEYKDDPYGNFDALAAIVGERYCFLKRRESTGKNFAANIAQR